MDQSKAEHRGWKMGRPSSARMRAGWNDDAAERFESDGVKELQQHRVSKNKSRGYEGITHQVR